MTEQKKTQSVWKSYRFPILLISSIIIGSIIGLVMGEKATVLKPFGDIFLNLMFTAIVPLVFATIASAIGNMLNMKRLGKILGSLLAVFVVTGLIAGVIIIFIVTIYPPAAGVHITMEAAGEMEAVKLSYAIVNALTVSDFSALLSPPCFFCLYCRSIEKLLYSVLYTVSSSFPIFYAQNFQTGLIQSQFP